MADLTRRGTFAALGLAASPAGARASEPDESIDLWPTGAPGGERVRVAQELISRPHPTLQDRIVRGVRRPTLSVFRARQPTGAAALIIPGGGYKHVVVDKEGFETARWLAERGVTAFVLLYRLPHDGWTAGPDAPLQDAQRALRLVRTQAGRLGFRPDHVAVQGFSAGGHLAARLTTRFDLATYAPVDAVDRQSARPDVSGLIYPVVSFRADIAHPGSRWHMLGDAPTPEQAARYSADTDIPPNTPPVFLMHAADDDTVPVENAYVLHAALRAAKIPTELHIFEEGGHGFGLRGVPGKSRPPWPDLFLHWWKRRWV